MTYNCQTSAESRLPGSSPMSYEDAPNLHCRICLLPLIGLSFSSPSIAIKSAYLCLPPPHTHTRYSAFSTPCGRKFYAPLRTQLDAHLFVKEIVRTTIKNTPSPERKREAHVGACLPLKIRLERSQNRIYSLCEGFRCFCEAQVDASPFLCSPFSFGFCFAPIPASQACSEISPGCKRRLFYPEP